MNQLAAQRDITLVCVNPMLVGKAREAEGYTRDKSDDKDAVLIARLVTQLNRSSPNRPEESWARLHQLGGLPARADQQGHRRGAAAARCAAMRVAGSTRRGGQTVCFLQLVRGIGGGDG